MSAEHDGHLGAVYAAKGPAEIAALYDGWAASYDADMARSGYRHPQIATALLARHLPAGPGAVLDAGCGTGQLADWLGILGYPALDGLDLSDGMLAAARARGGYRALYQLALGGPLPFADAAYAGVISTGVLTTGHVGAEALPELVRITAPGGTLVLTVKEPLWQEQVGPAIAAMRGVTLVDSTVPYASMPADAATVKARAVVLARG
jgi:SAM-dependent methyltransferase